MAYAFNNTVTAIIYLGYIRYGVFEVIPPLQEVLTIAFRSIDDTRHIYGRFRLLLAETSHLRRVNLFKIYSNPPTNRVLCFQYSNVNDFIEQFTSYFRSFLPTLRAEEALVVQLRLQIAVVDLKAGRSIHKLTANDKVSLHISRDNGVRKLAVTNKTKKFSEATQ